MPQNSSFLTAFSLEFPQLLRFAEHERSMIALGAVASAFGAVVFMVHPLISQAKSSLVTPLQVQPFLIGDIVTTVSKARDQSASANDIQARSALNSFAGILLRYTQQSKPYSCFIILEYFPLALCMTVTQPFRLRRALLLPSNHAVRHRRLSHVCSSAHAGFPALSLFF